MAYQSQQQQQPMYYGSQQGPVMGVPQQGQYSLYASQQQQQPQQEPVMGTAVVVVQQQQQQVAPLAAAEQPVVIPMLCCVAIFGLSLACCFTPLYSAGDASYDWWSTLYVFQWKTSVGTIQLSDGYGCSSFTYSMAVVAVFTVLTIVTSLPALFRCSLLRKPGFTLLQTVLCARSLWIVIFESVCAWGMMLAVYFGGYCDMHSLHHDQFKLKASFGMMVAASGCGLIALHLVNTATGQLRAAANAERMLLVNAV